MLYLLLRSEITLLSTGRRWCRLYLFLLFHFHLLLLLRGGSDRRSDLPYQPPVPSSTVVSDDLARVAVFSDPFALAYISGGGAWPQFSLTPARYEFQPSSQFRTSIFDSGHAQFLTALGLDGPGDKEGHIRAATEPQLLEELGCVVVAEFGRLALMALHDLALAQSVVHIAIFRGHGVHPAYLDRASDYRCLTRFGLTETHLLWRNFDVLILIRVGFAELHAHIIMLAPLISCARRERASWSIVRRTMLHG